jgi:hypothetical protein
MSEASRAIALQHAAAVHHGSGDTEMVLATAEAFHDFIVGNAGAATQSAAPIKVLEKKKAAPKSAPAKVAPPVVEEDAEPAVDEVSKEQVGEVIEAMLNANMRKQAVELFAKYKAKSLSGVKPEDYAALKQDADDLLLNA